MKKRVGHWWKNPKNELFDESHTLRTYWDEEKYCFRCGNCNTEVKEGTVCKCAKENI
ncbi:hypothetical protein KSU1_C0885 [Candidatus Jettenia caeni]|uniref:Uncharacterized protein n=1 Tax=Candidatus Jettenia caeni TaxID=247490 RepID=I3IL86_9BACT|nr:hypothetical protein [Candidatus Jettenia sp. AMX1]NUN22056.1 hypothetical protein [Candidatus Jettenia caeni]WKZ14321.1 MAG: hypothetical protein QY317_10435 [Candidatus Jettenia caeni]GAB62481.1 hypothetical protein KSU1_C0885 [Candidatus Jettenia caeni]GIL20115.1 MAG: hypothetical protein BroJett041_12290 [Candidatus Jettenia caeni]GJQ46435.1 MAG: hypothetical protein JETCAE04_21890 [Candidatus Jettenia caeni]